MRRELDKLIAEYRALQPLKAEYKKKLDDKFRLEFNYNSNHLEGNTLTYVETKLLLLFDQVKDNHEMRELEEMKAHDVALFRIKEEANDTERPLTEGFIKELNELILVRPFYKEAQTADGQATRRLIKVGAYKEYPNSVIQANGEVFEYASPSETPLLMHELVQWYNEEVAKGELSAVQLAALLHYRYIRIHPFDDGNGRVARLLVNYVLFRNDLPAVIIKTDNKKDYLRALQQADAGDLQAFVDYMIQQLAWSVDLCIKAAKGENIDEQDDWEKQLALIKKNIGDKSTVVLKKSEETVRSLFYNLIEPLILFFDEKMAQFDSLFMSNAAIFNWNENINKGENLVSLLQKKYSYLNNWEKSDDFVSLKKFLIGFEFYTFRKPSIETTLVSIPITFILGQNAYVIEYDNESISRLYNDFLNEDEMNEIVSLIARNLVEQIAELIKNN